MLITNERHIMTFSGLFGIPTHRLYRLQHADFGYGLVGLGVQLDGVYSLTPINSLLYGIRSIHFIPRQGKDPDCREHRFTLGNIADLFLADKNTWRNHGLEYGYTARFRFGAQCSPPYDEIVQKANCIRSNFYIVYKYKFDVNEVANRLLFYLSYGFDHTPRVYGNKYIVTLWTSWNAAF